MMKVSHDDAEAMPCKPHLPGVEVARLRKDRDALSQINKNLAEENHSLHALLYEIRVAAGDPDGRLMQDGLIELIRGHREAYHADA